MEVQDFSRYKEQEYKHRLVEVARTKNDPSIIYYGALSYMKHTLWLRRDICSTQVMMDNDRHKFVFDLSHNGLYTQELDDTIQRYLNYVSDVVSIFGKMEHKGDTNYAIAELDESIDRLEELLNVIDRIEDFDVKVYKDIFGRLFYFEIYTEGICRKYNIHTYFLDNKNSFRSDLFDITGIDKNVKNIEKIVREWFSVTVFQNKRNKYDKHNMKESTANTIYVNCGTNNNVTINT